MSRIDGYKYKLLGFINCNSDYDFVYYSNTRKIAIYQLLEDIPEDEDSFDGKCGDILVGGGRGEALALRISFPNAFKFFTQSEFEDFNKYDELFKCFWTPTQSFKICNGFLKSDWDLDVDIEFWLAEQICCILIKDFPEYSNFDMIELSIKLEFEKIN